jgi:tryptophan synthase alpha chain
MNRIDRMFRNKKKNILSIYFTAGYPALTSTAGIIKDLSTAGVDMIEIGMPFSDPLADGPVLQQSNTAALQNGMSIRLLFGQLEDIRKEVTIPLILMGYLNPVLKFGMEEFCLKCAETGIDGVIIPDLPPEVWTEQFRPVFEKYNLYNILLVSPRTDDDRIRKLDSLSSGFLYIVSSSSTTGIREGLTQTKIEYLKKLQGMDLKNPGLIGFGISDANTFSLACNYSQGAIIGSAFVKMLGEKSSENLPVREFISSVTGSPSLSLDIK